MSTQDPAAALDAARELVARAEAGERARAAAEAQAQFDALTAFQAATQPARAALNAAVADLLAAVPESAKGHATYEAITRIVANLDLLTPASGSLIDLCQTTIRRAQPTAE